MRIFILLFLFITVNAADPDYSHEFFSDATTGVTYDDALKRYTVVYRERWVPAGSDGESAGTYGHAPLRIQSQGYVQIGNIEWYKSTQWGVNWSFEANDWTGWHNNATTYLSSAQTVQIEGQDAIRTAPKLISALANLMIVNENNNDADPNNDIVFDPATHDPSGDWDGTGEPPWLQTGGSLDPLENEDANGTLEEQGTGNANCMIDGKLGEGIPVPTLGFTITGIETAAQDVLVLHGFAQAGTIVDISGKTIIEEGGTNCTSYRVIEAIANGTVSYSGQDVQSFIMTQWRVYTIDGGANWDLFDKRSMQYVLLPGAQTYIPYRASNDNPLPGDPDQLPDVGDDVDMAGVEEELEQINDNINTQTNIINNQLEGVNSRLDTLIQDGRNQQDENLSKQEDMIRKLEQLIALQQSGQAVDVNIDFDINNPGTPINIDVDETINIDGDNKLAGLNNTPGISEGAGDSPIMQFNVDVPGYGSMQMGFDGNTSSSYDSLAVFFKSLFGILLVLFWTHKVHETLKPG